MFLNIDKEENVFSLRCDALTAGNVIRALTAKSILEVSPLTALEFHSLGHLRQVVRGPLVALMNMVGGFLWPKKPCQEFLAKLAESDHPLSQLVDTAVGVAIVSSVGFAQCTRPLDSSLLFLIILFLSSRCACN